MTTCVVLDGARTPIGKLLGVFSTLSAVDLGGIAIKAAVERSGVTADQIDAVVFGNVVQAGVGPNPARQAAAAAGLPLSGIGGITTWRDAAEFIAMGCGTVQVCTAAMVYGFKIVQDMASGLSNWMDDKGFTSIEQFRGRALPTVTEWQHLNLRAVSKAVIAQDKCIACGRCHIACEDTSHQAIAAKRVDGKRRYEVIDEECVGCNLCYHACPVPNVITMVPQETGKPYLNWTQDPRNPMRKKAAE